MDICLPVHLLAVFLSHSVVCQIDLGGSLPHGTPGAMMASKGIKRGKQMLKMSLACLAVVVGFSQSSHAAGEGIEIDIWGASADAMIAKSKATRSTDQLKSKLLGETITFTYDVFDYDSNWKCFSRKGYPTPKHSIGRRMLNGEVPPETYCAFKKGLNPAAALRAAPEPVEFKLHPEMLDRLLNNAQVVETRSEKIAGHLGAKEVKFKILQLAGWECRVVDSSSSLPFGAKIDAKSCAYTPAGGEIATAQSSSSNRGVVR